VAGTELSVRGVIHRSWTVRLCWLQVGSWGVVSAELSIMVGMNRS
jgi:hypothetical protein